MNNIAPKFKFLWFLTLSYAMIIVMANWFDARLVHLFGLDTDAGTLIFPLTFLLSDLITEVYGYKHARRAIWAGFLFNLIYILYGQLVIHLPSSPYAAANPLFDQVMAINLRIIIASLISYLIAEPLNSVIMAKIKIKMQGKFMSLRFVVSTVVASGFDSFIFGSLAFAGTMSHYNLLVFILTMWLIKVIVEIAGLPLSVRLANKLKRSEQLDIYDLHTRFTLFSLDDQYPIKDNKFSS